MKLNKYLTTLAFSLTWLLSIAQEVKIENQALYLLNFIKYFEWTSEEIIIGVVGNSPIVSELELQVKQNPKVKLRKNVDEVSVKDCSMVFIPEAHTSQFELIQESIGKEKIILVTENESLASQGAEISFYVLDNKLKFIANRTALNDSGIKLSTKLLHYAKVIK